MDELPLALVIVAAIALVGFLCWLTGSTWPVIIFLFIIGVGV